MATLPREVLAECTVLFDDVPTGEIDPRAHSAFVIARVLDRGTLCSVAALVRTYGLERIRAFFRDGRAFQVSPRTTALWASFLDLDENECTSTSSPRVRSASWND